MSAAYHDSLTHSLDAFAFPPPSGFLRAFHHTKNEFVFHCCEEKGRKNMKKKKVQLYIIVKFYAFFCCSKAILTVP
jgi:hypothetical protein